ncbi:MAG TPA: PIG-L deacetylase family protein [Vicinamibacterales bacterium]|nr:PIG-L deacetylase family protein [Vicinamibacterales bacterium]
MTLRLMCVLAHPDDESLGTGGTLARYAAEGVETSLLTATRGERGRFGDAGEQPGPDVVGRTREAELRAAADILGIRDLAVLGYPDGTLDSVDPMAAQEAIASHFCRVKPHVVITFGPDGAYGHPDHVAISQLTTAAVVRAATMGHQVSKLYYIAWSAATWAAYQGALKTLSVKVDGIERRTVPAPDWAITTRIDASAVWQTVWNAVQCHRTQISVYRHLYELTPDRHRALWGVQEFYRAFSRVNGGRAHESDLLDGLR